MRTFESRHVKSTIALAVILITFSVVLYDTSVHIGKLEGPRFGGA